MQGLHGQESFRISGVGILENQVTGGTIIARQGDAMTGKIDEQPVRLAHPLRQFYL